MIWTPLSILHAIFPAAMKRDAARMARRWTEAARAEPRLVEDMIELGGVLTGQPVDLVDGSPILALPPEARLAYNAGRRDAALQLLALMSLTPNQLHALMKEPDYEDV